MHAHGVCQRPRFRRGIFRSTGIFADPVRLPRRTRPGIGHLDVYRATSEIDMIRGRRKQEIRKIDMCHVMCGPGSPFGETCVIKSRYGPFTLVAKIPRTSSGRSSVTYSCISFCETPAFRQRSHNRQPIGATGVLTQDCRIRVFEDWT